MSPEARSRSAECGRTGAPSPDQLEPARIGLLAGTNRSRGPLWPLLTLTLACSSAAVLIAACGGGPALVDIETEPSALVAQQGGHDDTSSA